MSHELQNVPFFWTALAHFASCMLYSRFLPRRFSRGRTLLLSALFLGILEAFMYVTAPQDGALFNFMMGCFAVLTEIGRAHV